MNKATRILAIAGMAVAGGATIAIGASPAMASSSTTSPGTSVAAASHAGDRIVGYFRSYGQCEQVGDRGEWTNRWDDHDCYRISYGYRRGWVALSVSWDRYNNGDNWHNGGGNWHGGDSHHGNSHHGNSNHGDSHHGNSHHENSHHENSHHENSHQERHH